MSRYGAVVAVDSVSAVHSTVSAGHRAAIPPRQYSRGAVLGVWAAAAVPMGVLAWIVAPAVAGTGAADRRFFVTLVAALTAGLVWQFVLVVALVAREQCSLRWAVVREALWLTAPSDPAGRRGGRLWLWAAVFAAGYAALQFVPLNFPEPDGRSLGRSTARSPGSTTSTNVNDPRQHRGAHRDDGLPGQAVPQRLARHHRPLHGEPLLRRHPPRPRRRLTDG